MKTTLFKYRVKFQTERQIDGWTDPANDLEYDVVKETITVKARNKEQAKRVACEEAYGWSTCHYPTHYKWEIEDIKSISRVRKERGLIGCSYHNTAFSKHNGICKYCGRK